MPGKCNLCGMDSVRFHSAGEAKRFCFLRGLELAGVITELATQIPFLISINGESVCRYIADFTYKICGRLVVEDFKESTPPPARLSASSCEPRTGSTSISCRMQHVTH